MPDERVDKTPLPGPAKHKRPQPRAARPGPLLHPHQTIIHNNMIANGPSPPRGTRIRAAPAAALADPPDALRPQRPGKRMNHPPPLQKHQTPQPERRLSLTTRWIIDPTILYVYIYQHVIVMSVFANPVARKARMDR